MNVQTIVFSKDRALQLHGLLSSFVERCFDAGETKIAVIFKASSGEYEAAYESLRNEFAQRLAIEWVKEGEFKSDLTRLVPDGRDPWWRRLFGSSPSDDDNHLLFLVDDCLFTTNFSLLSVLEALERFPRSIGFSLRVGKNTTYCYSNSCPQPWPEFENAGKNILRFRWPGQAGDFGYPLEVSSSVYRTKDLVGLLKNLPYSNPNRLEQALAISSRLLAHRRPDLLCFEQSVAFCAPVNLVQQVLNNRAGNAEEHSSANLNCRFLQGWRINVEALNGFVPRAAHEEIELPLRRA